MCLYTYIYNIVTKQTKSGEKTYFLGYLFLCLLDLVATLEVVGNTSISLLEGNFNSTSTVTLCLSLVGVSGGLRRDIVVNVTTVEGSATGGCS